MGRLVLFGSGSLCFFPNTRTAITANTRPHLVFVWLWVFLFLPEHTNGEHGEHTSTLGLCLAPPPIFFGSGPLYFFLNTRTANTANTCPHLVVFGSGCLCFFPNTRTANTANTRPHLVCVWLQLQFSLALGLFISSRTHERRTRRTHVHTWLCLALGLFI